ncbi:MAG TPA: response regulator transcription factor [Puia sp.]|nr:response regulator transcription factor [Puia sp.]
MTRIKVLYAEDEIFLGKIVKETLDSRGFEVAMVTSGGEVLTTYREVMPDICILDVMMPDRNGFEVAEDIRAIDEDIPIIFLTAKTQTDDVVRGFRLGANDYIRKPFSMEELIVRIENLLRINGEAVAGSAAAARATAARAAADPIAIGTYVFYPHRQVLTGDGEERKLSYRETELLKQLWAGRNQIIAREDILRALWGNDSFLNSRNLDVYVTKLRSYLRGDERVEILTIKGVGYRFVLP